MSSQHTFTKTWVTVYALSCLMENMRTVVKCWDLKKRATTIYSTQNTLSLTDVNGQVIVTTCRVAQKSYSLTKTARERCSLLKQRGQSVGKKSDRVIPWRSLSHCCHSVCEQRAKPWVPIHLTNTKTNLSQNRTASFKKDKNVKTTGRNLQVSLDS